MNSTGVPEIDKAFNGGLPPCVVIIEDKAGGVARLLDQAPNTVLHSYDAAVLQQQFQAGTNLLVVDLWSAKGGVPPGLNTTLDVVRASHPKCTLVLVVDLAAAELVRLADIAITVTGSTWNIIKSRFLALKSSAFEVVPRPAVAMNAVRIPTGLVALDAALGGGLPQGLVVMRGNRENIARVRNAMEAVPDGFLVLWKLDAPIDVMANTLGDDIAHNARNREMMILDFGDLTKKFPFDPVQVRGPMLSVVDRALDSIKPVCVLIEAHINRESDSVLTDVADVVLKATDEGPWYVQKPYGGRMVAYEEAEKFDPLEVPKPSKQPLTPERVLNALLSDPNLFIAVAKKMKVAQPWQAVGNDWFQRPEVVFDFNVLIVRKEQKGWMWCYFVPIEGSTAEEANNRAFFATAEEAKKSGDEWLRGQGWYVL